MGYYAAEKNLLLKFTTFVNKSIREKIIMLQQFL